MCKMNEGIIFREKKEKNIRDIEVEGDEMYLNGYKRMKMSKAQHTYENTLLLNIGPMIQVKLTYLHS